MLSYKQWKTVNESVMGGGCLGVSNPNSLGVMNKFGLVEMAKKKSKKKMDFDMEDEDETGDGEVVDAASEKDEPEIDVDDSSGEENDAGCNMCGKNSKKKSTKKSAKKSLKKSKKKMWGDEDDASGEDDMGDEEMGDEDEDLEAAEEESGEDLDGDDEEGESEDHIAKMKAAKGKAHTALAMGGGEDEAPMFSKKKSKKKSEKKSEKKMQKEAVAPEDAEWWNSVKNMLGAPVEAKFDDGWTQYHDPLDPLPGEVGFAPQGKIGS